MRNNLNLDQSLSGAATRKHINFSKSPPQNKQQLPDIIIRSKQTMINRQWPPSVQGKRGSHDAIMNSQ